MRTCPVPIVAAVNGPAIGLGCSLALSCDLVMMAEDAYLADPHVSRGLVAGDGGAAMFPVLAPFMRAKQFLFTGDPIPATLAVQLGMAISVLPADDVLATAVELAHRLAEQPAQALQATKKAINLHLEQAAVVAAFASRAEAQTLRSDEFAAAFHTRLQGGGG
jgi:enoyl-CoA hydratase